MSEACNQTPFWQRQPVLPRAVQAVLRARLEAALADPHQRQVLAWPTILAAPKLRESQPLGLPEAELLRHATPMLRAVGVTDPGQAWSSHRAAWPDTAQAGQADQGDQRSWLPGPTWGAWGPLVSLRCGWQLAALTPLPLGESYALASGVSLFNHGLFHECHDALEPLWDQATGALKHQFQGLILLAAGYHHLQMGNLPGLVALWADAIRLLEGGDGQVLTPWGHLRYGTALDLTVRRLDDGKRMHDATELEPLWALDRPTWELS